MRRKSTSGSGSARRRTGLDLLRDPLLNKGTAFTYPERDALGLRGLLPPAVISPEQQLARVLDSLRAQPTDLDKFINLNALHDRNETLFFRLVLSHPDEILPLIYTPTVGLACQRYAHIFQRPRGIWISTADRGRIAATLRNWPTRDVKILVVTDGERILGLGDLGANGMGIPVGKLSLYTACAGVHPASTLPVLLDVGTNNAAFLQDPLYIGLKQPRIRGAEYDELIDEFISAASEVFPGVVIQFEDFANRNAFRLLQKYRDKVCCFNDDIQGTASVALAGLLSALRVTGSALTSQRLLFLGAGEAATGICDLIVTAMVGEGMAAAEARNHCWLFDSQGLVVASRAGLSEHKRAYAHEHAQVPSFLAALKTIRPTAIIGVAGVGKSFTREALEEMAHLNERPIIFALSNPTSQAECTAQEAYLWTAGRALFACGSPFEPVVVAGHTHVPRQGNNSYIFPGVGLGLTACEARRATDEMFLVAARELTAMVTAQDLDQGSLYPPLAQVREISARIAAAVTEVAFSSGVAGVARPANPLDFVKSKMYEPRYPSYI